MLNGPQQSAFVHRQRLSILLYQPSLFHSSCTSTPDSTVSTPSVIIMGLNTVLGVLCALMLQYAEVLAGEGTGDMTRVSREYAYSGEALLFR